MNWNWNSTARPAIRIGAGLIGLLGLLMGGGLLFSADHSASTTYAAVGMISSGVMFVVIAVRGRVVKRDIG